MTIDNPGSRPHSPTLSSASSTSDGLAHSWNSTSESERRTTDGETPGTSLPSSSAPSPSPDSKINDTIVTTSRAVREFKAGLPTPFWPASLLDRQYPKNDQGPHLPPEFPPVPVNATPGVVADADIRTPDSWVQRNPQLIRLTGKHPLNVEGKLSDVFASGFLTPAHLHFVRNHGAVPRLPSLPAFLPSPSLGVGITLAGLSDSAKVSVPRVTATPNLNINIDPYIHWSIRVHGLVSREQAFTIKQLAETFKIVTLPVTLVCAGNRRKEQNVVRKSLGFDWGAAGVSTALWTGVYLSDILEYVRPVRPAAKHVIFEGADELPKGPYGTSQKLSWAADKGRGMLIAWAMNGLPLEPDHGFPVRLIVPGQIGGRMVKWLTRIEISDVESNHYLHYWDNKVLPTQLSPEQARDEPQWWYDPKYIITELNVNSAIAHPAHGETFKLSTADLNPELEATEATLDLAGAEDRKSGEYIVKGYAYGGGGRRITRVELSWDDGQTWNLTDIDYPEDQFRRMKFEHPVYGLLDLRERDTCFCWCFWVFRLPFAILAKADSLMVRAMDESMNTQPRDMYLNATSMLNNWWFRIAISRTVSESGVKLYFEHPAVVGTSRPGWMDRMKAEGKDILRPVFTSNSSSMERQSDHQMKPTVVPVPETICMTNPDIKREISVEELRAQDKEKPRFVVNGEVYDATEYLKDHPGGADSILLVAGEDATDDFMAIHSADAKKKLAEFHIGTLLGGLTDCSPPIEHGDDNADAPFLDPKTWRLIVLSEIQRVNHDSLIYRFSLPSAEQEVGLPVGQHVFVRLRRKDTQELVQRAYTPVSREDARGSLEFLIKLYLPSDEYPLGGKMSVGFNQLEVGDTIEVKGPLGSLIWKGAGNALWKGIPRKVTDIGLVCGGSGITPILQVIRSVLHDSDNSTRLYLISSNKTEVDILCREELDALLHAHNESGRFHLHYTLGRPPARGWTYSEGHVNEEMLREHLPPPGAGRMVLACGPPAMVEDTVREGLQKLGWDVEKDFVVF